MTKKKEIFSRPFSFLRAAPLVLFSLLSLVTIVALLAKQPLTPITTVVHDEHAATLVNGRAAMAVHLDSREKDVSLLEAVANRHKASYRYYYDECYGQRYYSGSSSSSADDGTRGMTMLDKRPEWSHDAWRVAHCGRIADGIAKLQVKHMDSRTSKQILFVDAKEECGRYREFLLTVRESGYAGMIVMLIYYAEDLGPCNELLVAAFAPLEVFYHPSPRVEASMMQYYALKAFYSTDGGNAQGRARLRQYPIAATVRPEWVQWCKNPFPELIAKAGLGSALHDKEESEKIANNNRGTVFVQMASPFGMLYSSPPSTGFTFGTSNALAVLAALAVDHFPHLLGNSAQSADDVVFSLYQHRRQQQRGGGANDGEVFRGIVLDPTPHYQHMSSEMRAARAQRIGASAKRDISPLLMPSHWEPFSIRPLSDLHPSFPTAIVEGGLRCGFASKEACSGGTHQQLIVPNRHQFCFQMMNVSDGTIARTTDDPGSKVIASSPFCYLGYRNAVAEVPKAKLPDTIDALKHVTTANNFEAAMRIRKTAIETIYADPSPAEVKEKFATREWGGFSDECPDGKMAVMTMMGDYPLDKVRPFLESFVHYVDHKCSRLVILAKWAPSTAPDDGSINTLGHATPADEENMTRPAAALAQDRNDLLSNKLLAFVGQHRDRMEIVYYVTAEAHRGELEAHLSSTVDDRKIEDDVDGRNKTKEFAGSVTPKPSINSKTQTVFEPTAGRPRITVVLPHAQYRNVPYVDQRFEVGREWLERNYKLYRYVSNIDSRDIVFLGDPLRQLVKILRENGPVEEPARKGTTSYIDDEFVASVTESYTIGGSSPLNVLIAKFGRRWLRPFGAVRPNVIDANGEPMAIRNASAVHHTDYVHDYLSGHTALMAQHWGAAASDLDAGLLHRQEANANKGRMADWALQPPTFTNGDSYAVVNSGHIIGTAVGLLHYYRLHVRMTVESKFKFDTSDQGTFTFYFYMVAPVTNYPHRLLGIHSSRSGFANPPHFNRVTRRRVKGSSEVDSAASSINHDASSFDEYAVRDCAGNYVAVLHQFDRAYELTSLLRKSASNLYALQHSRR